jgi:uncharacterized LabA/DUF88 family protein
MAFIDGANLFNSAKRRFGYWEPNCDIARLVNAIVALTPGRAVAGVFYYIGIPKLDHDRPRCEWWNRKLAAMGRTGVKVVKRDLKARELKIDLAGIVNHKGTHTKLIEKGIDLRLGLDLIKHTTSRSYDVAIIFSQDGDLAEAVDDAYMIAKEQHRSIRIECAYPIDAGGVYHGIRRTFPLTFDKVFYDACIDPRDYRRP